MIQVEDKAFRIREIIPEENRSDLERFRSDLPSLRLAIQTAGRLTGLSHLRGARAVGEHTAVEQLLEWTRGTSLNSVLALALRFAEQTWLDHAAVRDELDRVSLRGVLRETRVGE